MDWFKGLGAKGIGAGVCSLAVFVMVGAWLIVVARYVAAPPVLDASGKVTFDKFGNAKDILLALLPLATTSLGYWYGSQGTSSARDVAATATDAAGNAAKDAAAANAKFAALLDQTQPGALTRAKEAHPEAFAEAVEPTRPSSSELPKQRGSAEGSGAQAAPVDLTSAD